MGMTDVYMMSKGAVTTVHDAIQATATSDPVDCRGFNAVLVYFTTSAANNWTIKVQGSDTRNGTYADCYELANTGSMAAMSYQLNSNKVFLFKGIPAWIKIVATEDADGSTVTVKVQPLNV
jgi:hypothetical protein